MTKTVLLTILPEDWRYDSKSTFYRAEIFLPNRYGHYKITGVRNKFKDFTPIFKFGNRLVLYHEFMNSDITNPSILYVSISHKNKWNSLFMNTRK